MPSWLRLLPVIFVLIGGCRDAAPEAAPTPCPSPSPAANLRALPRDLPLQKWGTVTAVSNPKGFIGAEIVATTTVVELHPVIARALLDAGYKIVGADNEGFESELFFARNQELSGAFRLREGPCEGQVTVRLLYPVKR